MAPAGLPKRIFEVLARNNYDIHVGNVLGFPGRVAMFLAVLVGASLPVTGFLIWWGRRKKVRSHASARPALSKKPYSLQKTY